MGLPHLIPTSVLGHEEDQEILERTDLPNAGRVCNLRREGSLLLADVCNTPLKVSKLVSSGAYSKVSAELYDDVPEGLPGKGKTLRRIAYLGSEIPQVKTLDDIPVPDRDGIIHGVEIFEAGTYRKGTPEEKTYTTEDLDDVVRNFYLQTAPVSYKLGNWNPPPELKNDINSVLSGKPVGTDGASLFSEKKPNSNTNSFCVFRDLPKKVYRFTESHTEPNRMTPEQIKAALIAAGAEQDEVAKMSDGMLKAFGDFCKKYAEDSAKASTPNPDDKPADGKNSEDADTDDKKEPAKMSEKKIAFGFANHSRDEMKKLVHEVFSEQFKPAALEAKKLSDEASKQVQELKNQKRMTEFDAFCERLKNEGRMTPAEVKSAREFALDIVGDPAVVKFSEGDKETQGSKIDKYQAQLASRPVVVKFGEIAPGGKGIPSTNLDAEKEIAAQHFDSNATEFAKHGIKKDEYVKAFAAFSEKKPGTTFAQYLKN